MPSDELLRPGTVFARYRVTRQLGEGAFGFVYEAVSTVDRRPVALKVLRAEVSGNAEVLARFFVEAQAVAKMRHPNIVEAIDMGDFGGRPFLAMELLHGETLAQYLTREAPMEFERALALLLPVMSAMRCVHAQGILHRDLKPENIFLTTDEKNQLCPKVLDFGFAKIAQAGLQVTRHDRAIGTPNFMSPEQLHSPLKVGPACDQWSMGVLLYYALTGVKPFEGAVLMDTFQNVLKRDPPPLRQRAKNLPPGAEGAVLRALRKVPEERYPSVKEMARALVKCIGDGSIQLRTAEFAAGTAWHEDEDTNPRAKLPPPPVHSLQPVVTAAPAEAPTEGGGRRRVMLGVAIATLGVAAGVTGALLMTQRSDETPRMTVPTARDAGVDAAHRAR